jgi:uncharacterized membrane protein
MQNSNYFRNILFVCIGLLPLLYLAVMWNTIPEIVPIHFNAKYEPDDHANKIALWGLAGTIATVSILCYFLMRNIHRIDPKRSSATSPSSFNKLGAGMIIFMSALNFLILLSCIKPELKLIDKLLMPLVGGLFLVIGNYMYSVKPNYFAGYKLPWTLANDENWHKTHRLAGRLWFIGGLALICITPAVDGETDVILLVSIIAVLVVVPITFSIMHFMKQKKQGNAQ